MQKLQPPTAVSPHSLRQNLTAHAAKWDFTLTLRIPAIPHLASGEMSVLFGRLDKHGEDSQAQVNDSVCGAVCGECGGSAAADVTNGWLDPSADYH